jgi:hypothetical protein
MDGQLKKASFVHPWLCLTMLQTGLCAGVGIVFRLPVIAAD